jgi:hypothetical protein
MKSDTPIDDPCDGVSVEDLAGWTKYDSSGMRETINGKRLERDSGDRYQDSWLRFDNG